MAGEQFTKASRTNRVVTNQSQLDAAIVENVALIIIRPDGADAMHASPTAAFTGSLQLESGFLKLRGSAFVAVLGEAQLEAHDKVRVTAMNDSTVFCYDHVWAVAYGCATLVSARWSTDVSLRTFTGSTQTRIVTVG